IKFEETVAATIQPGSLVPELTIDTELPFEAIRPSFYNILEQMQPFGPANAQPVFVARNLTDKGSRIVKDLHVRFCLQQNGILMDGIGFGLAGKFPLLRTGAPIDLVFTVEENEWNNQKNLQLKVIDFALSA
ncbi:MAG: single-stranded-DNA-specific exonuclease RecJ, partial [Bacteroidetes bacterium]|nr:single-stranded-DNA-specific exonuclease RecJ [Bacteroidota bacterium]